MVDEDRRFENRHVSSASIDSRGGRAGGRALGRGGKVQWSLTDSPLVVGKPADGAARERGGGVGAGLRTGAEERHRDASAAATLNAAWLNEMEYEAILRGHSGAVTSLSMPDDGSLLLSGGTDHEVHTFEFGKMKPASLRSTYSFEPQASE